MKKILVVGVILLFLGPSIAVVANKSPAPLSHTFIIGGDDCVPVFEPTRGNNGWIIRVNVSFEYNPSVVLEIQYKSQGAWVSYAGPFTVKSENDMLPFAFRYKTTGSGGEWINDSSGIPGVNYYDFSPPYLQFDKKILLFKIVYTAVVQDNISLMDRVEFWIGDDLQYTAPITDPSGVQTAVWILSPIPHANITVTAIAYDLAGNSAKASINIDHRTSFDQTLPSSQRQSSPCVQHISQNLQISQLLQKLVLRHLMTR